MLSQAEEVRALAASCRLLRETAEGYVQASAQIDDTHAGLYMVSVAHTVQRRAAELKSEFAATPSSPPVLPRVRASMRPSEIRSISRLVQSVGSIEADDIPPYRSAVAASNINADDRDWAKKESVPGPPFPLSPEHIKHSPSVVRIPLTVALRLSSGYDNRHCSFLFFYMNCLTCVLTRCIQAAVAPLFDELFSRAQRYPSRAGARADKSRGPLGRAEGAG